MKNRAFLNIQDKSNMITKEDGCGEREVVYGRLGTCTDNWICLTLISSSMGVAYEVCIKK